MPPGVSQLTPMMTLEALNSAQAWPPTFSSRRIELPWVITALTTFPPPISTSTSVLTGPSMILAIVPQKTFRALTLASCRSVPMMTELALMMA